MKFNLKLYITEKLLSSVIVNELLNDTGGFFKYYKVQYKKDSNHLYDKAFAYYKRLQSIIGLLYTTNYKDTLKRKYAAGNIPDEKYIKAYNNYMKLYAEYQKLFVRLFKDPSVDTLSTMLFVSSLEYLQDNIVNYSINISNITDDMFKKYTYTEIKNNKILYDNILSYINNSDLKLTIFWMRSDKTILGVSTNNKVKLLKPNTDSYNRLVEYTSDKNNAEVWSYTDTLEDGTELKWPIVYGDYYASYHKHDVFQRMDADHVILNKDTYSYTYPTYNIGKFLSKASLLQKSTGWGQNPNDYIIIFADNFNLLKSKLSYINHKNKNINKSDERKQDVNLYVNYKFKWMKDIFGDIMPYRKEVKGLYDFMSKFSEYQHNEAYERDTYCIKLFLVNRKKYEILKQIKTSTKSITQDILLKYNKLVEDIKNYTSFGKQVIESVKTPGNNVSDIISLYSAYSYTLNQIILSCSKIYALIDSSNQTITQVNKDVLSMNPNSWRSQYNVELNSDNISRNVKSINDIFEFVDKNISAINICKLNIENLINNLE